MLVACCTEIHCRGRLQRLQIMVSVSMYKAGEVVYKCLAAIHTIMPESFTSQRAQANSSLIASSIFERKLFPIERAVALALARLCCCESPADLFRKERPQRCIATAPSSNRCAEYWNQHLQYIFTRHISARGSA
jgi:hypothetical protein